MVEAYWNIGKSIIEEQGGNEKAEYGTGLLKELSKQMTQDFGKGFTVANLKNMRQFYLTFPNGYALRSELSWTHYRLLMRVENENAREFYMQEAVKSQWSTRQLERQINSFFYERLLSSKNKEQVAEEIQTLEPAKKPEDIIRDPHIDPVAAVALKRRIDKSNQDRTDLVELIDSYFLDRYKDVKPLADATINTESPAWAVDRLSILALKIYHMQQEVERTDTTEEHRAQCQVKLDILLEQRKDLSSAIDQLLADIEAGKKYMKVYKQMKMYNDPALNPVLYAKK